MTVTYDQRTAEPFCDLSKYRTITDEAAFRAAKPIALGFRVHSDLSGQDPTWARDEAVAASLGIPRLGYDYEDDGTPDGFIDLFTPAKGRIPVLDAEYKGLTMTEAESWCATITRAWGRLPVIYGHSLIGQWKPSSDSILRRCPSWQATYGMSLNPVSWALAPFLWQYSDGATKWPSPGPRSFPGVGPCDMNALLIPLTSLRQMAGLEVQDVTPDDVNALIAAALATDKAPGSSSIYALRAQGDLDRRSAKFTDPRKPTDPHYMEGWNLPAPAGGIPPGTQATVTFE